MINKEKLYKERIYSKNIISKLFFYYINPLINLGENSNILINDLPDIEKNLNYKNQKDLFSKFVENNKDYSLKRIIILYIFPTWFFLFFGFLISNLLNGLIPIFLKSFINNLQNEFIFEEGIKYGCLIFSLIFIKPFLTQYAMLYGYKSVSKIISIYYYIVSTKITKLNNKSNSKINIGLITSFLSSDIIRIIISIMTGHQLIVL